MRLTQRLELPDGGVRFDVFGQGPPVVLVHGTPTRGYLWRGIIPALQDDFRVYVYDLLGYGDSDKEEDQDVSIAAQGRVLKQLVEAWELDRPAVAGHDIGGGIVLRAHLLEGVGFERIALLDGVVLNPWQTASSTPHIVEHSAAYQTMPDNLFEAVHAAYLAEAGSRLPEEAVEAYAAQWRGEQGRRGFLRQTAQLDPRHTEELQPLLGSISVPVQILWGADDRWMDPNQAGQLRDRIEGAALHFVPGSGHFIPEDAPEEVAGVLRAFLSGPGGT